MRAVVDTNVFVARLLSPTGAPARVFDLWEAEAFELLVSEQILAEYARVLAYPHLAARLRSGATAITEVLRGLRQFALFVEPEESLAVIEADPADDKFLECAVAGGAEYLVSGDRHLLQLGEYRGIQILPPAAFVTLLTRQQARE